MTFVWEDILKLLLSVAIGGLIGAEREFRDKAAGFRTIIFICVGSTLFTVLSNKLCGEGETNRITANIVTGIGFLGAGVILRAGDRIVGLTTASIIWISAAIGMGIGGNQYILSFMTTVIVLVILWIFPIFEEIIDKARESRTYEILCPVKSEKVKQLESMIKESNLHIRKIRHSKLENNVMLTFEATGSPRNHQKLIDKLLEDDEVKSFKF